MQIKANKAVKGSKPLDGLAHSAGAGQAIPLSKLPAALFSLHFPCIFLVFCCIFVIQKPYAAYAAFDCRFLCIFASYNASDWRFRFLFAAFAAASECRFRSFSRAYALLFSLHFPCIFLAFCCIFVIQKPYAAYAAFDCRFRCLFASYNASD